MRVLVCENYEEMSQAAAKIVASQLVLKPNSVLGLATGSTPVRMYELLAEKNKKNEIDFTDVVTYNLDEYYPIASDNDQSYRYFMDKKLFDHINIKYENTHILNGLTDEPDSECDNFEKMIDASGGIDLQILGIGENGHIGFNEPSSSLNSKTHLTDLTESTIRANSRFFEDIEDVPKQALTMGIATILKSKKIILLASGENKHKVVAELLDQNINTDNPASMLKVHSDVILICDKKAYYSEKLGIDIGGTDVKFGVLDDKKNLICTDSIPSDFTDEADLVNKISDKCIEIKKNYNITSVGIGVPGVFNDNKVTAINLPLNNTPLADIISKKIGVNVKICNDANVAAYGESECGVGKNYANIVEITIGTGIGGGIIIDNKLYNGTGNAGEIGHMCIEVNGRECRCGKKGCIEQYASATALTQAATKKALEDKNSILYELYKNNGNSLDGKLFFEALRKNCDAAKVVFEEYTDYLSAAVTSLISIFSPDAVVLSGGITNVGDELLQPLKNKVNTDVPIMISELKSNAGVIGAALL